MYKPTPIMSWKPVVGTAGIPRMNSNLMQLWVDDEDQSKQEWRNAGNVFQPANNDDGWSTDKRKNTWELRGKK